MLLYATNTTKIVYFAQFVGVRFTRRHALEELFELLFVFLGRHFSVSFWVFFLLILPENTLFFN